MHADKIKFQLPPHQDPRTTSASLQSYANIIGVAFSIGIGFPAYGLYLLAETTAYKGFGVAFRQLALALGVCLVFGFVLPSPQLILASLLAVLSSPLVALILWERKKGRHWWLSALVLSLPLLLTYAAVLLAPHYASADAAINTFRTQFESALARSPLPAAELEAQRTAFAELFQPKAFAPDSGSPLSVLLMGSRSRLEWLLLGDGLALTVVLGFSAIASLIAIDAGFTGAEKLSSVLSYLKSRMEGIGKTVTEFAAGEKNSRHTSDSSTPGSFGMAAPFGGGEWHVGPQLLRLQNTAPAYGVSKRTIDSVKLPPFPWTLFILPKGMSRMYPLGSKHFAFLQGKGTWGLTHFSTPLWWGISSIVSGAILMRYGSSWGLGQENVPVWVLCLLAWTWSGLMATASQGLLVIFDRANRLSHAILLMALLLGASSALVTTLVVAATVCVALGLLDIVSDFRNLGEILPET